MAFAPESDVRSRARIYGLVEVDKRLQRTPTTGHPKSKLLPLDLSQAGLVAHRMSLPRIWLCPQEWIIRDAALLIGGHQLADVWMVQILTHRAAWHSLSRTRRWLRAAGCGPRRRPRRDGARCEGARHRVSLNSDTRRSFMIQASVSRRSFCSGSKIKTFLMAT